MTPKSSGTIFRLALTLIGGYFAASLVLPAPSLTAAGRSGRIHATKACAGTYFGNAGDWCTIASSDIGPLPVGSRFLYSQAAGVPAGLLDSNVVLDAGDGNRAVGRCTLDLGTGLGLCTFHEGTGQFVGFEARIDVNCPTDDCTLDGSYKFRPND